MVTIKCIPWLFRLVFKSLRQIVGGELRVLLSGGAPLAPAAHDYCRTVLGIVLLQVQCPRDSTAPGTQCLRDSTAPGKQCLRDSNAPGTHCSTRNSTAPGTQCLRDCTALGHSVLGIVLLQVYSDLGIVLLQVYSDLGIVLLQDTVY